MGVNKNAVNIACRAEMGRNPIKLTIDKKIFKYYDRLNNLPETSIAKQALLISKQLHQNGVNCYVSKISKLLENIDDTNTINVSNISSTSLKTINTKLRVKYETFYKEKLSNSAKLKFLSSLKLTAENTSYLNDVKNVFFRNALTRLRISNHCLLIETGRYIQPKLDRDKRTCPHCLNNEIEDETHFLFNCSLYDYNRNTFYAMKLQK